MRTVNSEHLTNCYILFNDKRTSMLYDPVRIESLCCDVYLCNMAGLTS
jgi:hypothetical protein